MGATVRRSLRIGETVTLEMPFSEVAMHLRIAGEHRAVQVLEAGAQILNPDGSPYSFPILHGEAGIYRRENGTLWADVARTVRDLPNITLVRPEHWDGSTPEDPTAGEVSWPYGSWDRDPAEPTHAVLDLTVWSDYGGSTAERSNARSLTRDYPGTFIHLYGGHGTSGLMLPIAPPATYDADTWEYALEQLAHLEDYPVYDEEDLSALELELADEAWDAYLQWDVPRDLAKHGVPDDALTDTDRLQEMFYRITGDQPVPYEAETAVSAYFPHYDDTVATMAREMGGRQ